MEMRKSLVLRKLRSGEKVTCFKINLADARSVEIAALAGFDCIWVDQEHIGQDWSILASQIWAAKAHGKDVVVRVPRGSYSDYVKPLELDAAGIMVPHVMNVVEGAAVVRQVRFHPVGLRAIDGGNADGAYTAMDFKQYLSEANTERFVIFQIEDPEALDAIEEIAALDGFDMLFFGPGDFSQGIGAPGEWDHPKIQEARKRVAEVAANYGKFAGTTGGVGQLKDLYALGYQFVSIGADVVGLTQYCQKLLSEVPSTPAKTEGNSYYHSGDMQ
ncbi:MAG: aldolase [Lunatimonas sp.]|nr:aldolase [Lunatimonas sp.]